MQNYEIFTLTGEIISTVEEFRPKVVFIAFFRPSSDSRSGNFLRSKDIFCTAADLRGKVVALGPSSNGGDVTLVLLLLPVESLS